MVDLLPGSACHPRLKALARERNLAKLEGFRALALRRDPPKPFFHQGPHGGVLRDGKAGSLSQYPLLTIQPLIFRGVAACPGICGRGELRQQLADWASRALVPTSPGFSR
jgi:hypothetical protein